MFREHVAARTTAPVCAAWNGNAVSALQNRTSIGVRTIRAPSPQCGQTPVRIKGFMFIPLHRAGSWWYTHTTRKYRVGKGAGGRGHDGKPFPGALLPFLACADGAAVRCCVRTGAPRGAERPVRRQPHAYLGRRGRCGSLQCLSWEDRRSGKRSAALPWVCGVGDNVHVAGRPGVRRRLRLSPNSGVDHERRRHPGRRHRGLRATATRLVQDGDA